MALVELSQCCMGDGKELWRYIRGAQGQGLEENRMITASIPIHCRVAFCCLVTLFPYIISFFTQISRVGTARSS